MQWMQVRLRFFLLTDFRLHSSSSVVDRAQPSYTFNDIHFYG